MYRYVTHLSIFVILNEMTFSQSDVTWSIEKKKKNNKTAGNDIFVRDRYEMEYGLPSEV